MAEVKFTPGPWLLSFYEDDEWRVHGTGIHGQGTYAVADVINGNGDPQNEANAHLIAASPALYEALKRARNQLDEDCFTEESRESCLKFIYEVLALAEGKKE